MYICVPLIFMFVTMQDDLGSTALGVASQEGHVDVTRLLIERGAAIDYQNKVRAVVTV
jgi:ankyrin repeat protein